MRCSKCGKKTSLIIGKVFMQIGDTSFTTITDVGHCTPCNLQSVQFQCKIEPIIPVSQEIKEGEEKSGHA